MFAATLLQLPALEAAVIALAKQKPRKLANSQQVQGDMRTALSPELRKTLRHAVCVTKCWACFELVCGTSCVWCLCEWARQYFATNVFLRLCERTLALTARVAVT